MNTPQFEWIWDWLPWIALSWAVLAGLSYWEKGWYKAFGWAPSVRLDWPQRDRLPAIDVVADARRKAVRAQVRNYLVALYDKTTRHAIGDVFDHTERAIQWLRATGPENHIHVALSDLLIELRNRIQVDIGRVLQFQGCSDDAALFEYVSAWGELFAKYQFLVYANYRVWQQAGGNEDYWENIDYRLWRERDTTFIAAVKIAEDMEGCEALAQGIRGWKWGERFRP